MLSHCGSTPSATTDQPKSNISSGSALDFVMPSHWQQHWLDEPIFNGKVHLIETGKQHSQTLLLVHGLGQNGLRDWLDVIQQLELQYHIIALDLPGFGQSDVTALQLAPIQYARLLHWLLPRFTSAPVTVIGHSMGAAVSLRFAASYPQQVQRLIMVDTAGVLQRTVFVRHITQMPDNYDWLNPYQQYSLVEKAVGKVNRFVNRVSSAIITRLDYLPDPSQVLLNNRLAQQYLYKDSATLNAALGLVYENMSDAIDQLTMPVHIIWGANDHVAPIRTGRLLQHQLINAQLHLVENAGHVPMQDQPQVFMQQLQLALTQPPIGRSAAIWQNRPAINLPDLHCDNQHFQTYSGHYNRIVLHNCHYITLRDASASEIIISKSIVNLEQVEVQSSGLALKSTDSNVTLTNVTLQGTVAMQVNDSLIDAAGVQFTATNQAIVISDSAQLYFSICQLDEAGQHRGLHGMSLGKKLIL